MTHTAHRPILRAGLMALACAMALPPAALAQPATGTTTPGSEPDETIVVATFRAPVAARETGAALSILDRADLDRMQATLVSDALATLPGVAASRNGGPGAVAGVRIRGAESDHTVVLIDGVRISDPSAPGGGFDFASLQAGLIDRIEVLRGPQSALYGSEALGGVVNIVTRAPGGPGRADISAETGERGTANLVAVSSGTLGPVGFSAAAGHFRTDGFSAFDERLGGREADGHSRTGGSVRLVLPLLDTLELDVRASAARADTDIDGFAPPTFALGDTAETSRSEETTWRGGLAYTSPSGTVSARLAVSRAQTAREGRDPASGVPLTLDTLGIADALEAVVVADLTPGFRLTAGMEREESSYRTAFPNAWDPNPVPERAQARTDAAFADALMRPTPDLTLSAGLRVTDSADFGQAANWRGAVAWSLAGGRTLLRASAGDAFKAPSLFQLRSDFGNPALQPEEARAWDAGIEQRLLDGAVTVTATRFERTTRNRIDFVSCFGDTRPLCTGRPFGTYDNVARSTADGWEATLAAELPARFRLEGSFTSMEARNRTAGSPNNGRPLARRPDTTGSVSLSRRWDGGEAGVVVTGVGDAFDNAAATVLLPAHVTVTLRGSLDLGERLALFGRIENLGDAEAVTAARYGSSPRTAIIGIRARVW